MSTISPEILFTCHRGPVEILPPNSFDIGAEMPEEDVRLDVHEMIEISIFFRGCDLQLFDEARVLDLWTDYGGRMRACGYDETPGVDISPSDVSTSIQSISRCRGRYQACVDDWVPCIKIMGGRRSSPDTKN
ncbi:hypothetical protein FNYG_06171 [Fusarium nygamai]|uniref:Uncharacterized protein n=1 Tax=Gibberella nygamai TaxID=42673 RepID=A0A2K0WE71_GIBNY|nr:hypothetical protein FNYG_06171 [Fusarium nygamai]